MAKKKFKYEVQDRPADVWVMSFINLACYRLQRQHPPTSAYIRQYMLELTIDGLKRMNRRTRTPIPIHQCDVVEQIRKAQEALPQTDGDTLRPEGLWNALEDCLALCRQAMTPNALFGTVAIHFDDLIEKLEARV